MDSGSGREHSFHNPIVVFLTKTRYRLCLHDAIRFRALVRSDSLRVKQC